MSSVLSPRFSFGLLILSVWMIASTARSATVEDHIKKSFTVAPGGNLIMAVDRGSIDVKTTSNNRVEVEVIRRATEFRRTKADETLREHKIDFAQEGNDVQIRSTYRRVSRWFWFWQGNRLSVRYLILLPKQYQVDLKTAGGSISVADLEGNVKARTSGGRLRFGQINGPVWARTSGGSISLQGCRQSVDVETSGGGITIGDVEGTVTARTSGGSIRISQAKGDVTARTSGGGVHVDDALGKIDASTSGGSVSARLSRQPEGDCRLRTSGGSIEVRLAETIAVNLDARTSGGHVTTDLPVTVQGALKKTSLIGKLNGGGPALILHTSGGSVRIRKM